MNISYKRDMTHNYMVPELPEDICEDDYRIHMLLENHIRGLLPCSLKNVNCQTHFFYDITSRQSMEQIYGNRYLRAGEIRTLLRGLYRALKEVKKYLLDMDCIVLDPQMIYLDVETREPLFCYLPGYQKELLQSFAEWSAYLLEHLDRGDDQAVLLGYGIYQKAREENYPLEKILQEAVSVQERAYDEPEEFTGYQPRAPKEFAEYEPPEEGAKYQPYAQEGYGGGRRQAYEEEEYGGGRRQAYEEGEYIGRRQQAHEERGHGGRRQAYEEGEYGGRRRQTYEEGKYTGRRQQAREEREYAGQRPQEKSAKGRSKKGEERHADNRSVHSQKVHKEKKKPAKQKEEQKTSGRGFLLICFCAAAVLALAAAWLWGLNTTQIGGIVFLLVGLLAYGCSLESKKKKTEENWPDDYEEQPLYEESPVYEPSPYKEEAAYRRRGERDVPERWRGERDMSAKRHGEQDVSAKRHGEQDVSAKRRGERNLPESQRREWDMSAKRRGEWDVPERRHAEYASEEYEGGMYASGPSGRQTRLGDTGVLYEAEGDYEPFLVLISMNPHQRESVILEKDCYVVGKLASQADIVVDHPSVSRIHAKIERRGKEYYLCDLNSTNGTFLNGRRLAVNECAVLHPSDEVAFARAGYHVGKC